MALIEPNSHKLSQISFNHCRMMIFQDFYRFVCPEKIINRITYDLDELILGERNMFPQEPITSCFVISPKKASPSGSQSSNR